VPAAQVLAVASPHEVPVATHFPATQQPAAQVSPSQQA
jgi:hypothetical protein